MTTSIEPKSNTRELNDLILMPVERLQSFDIFRNTALSVIKKHLTSCQIQNYPSDKLLISPERQNHNVYALLEGQLSVHHSSAGAPPLTLLNAGETVGEISVFDEQKPSAFVKTTVPSKLLVISRDVLWDMIDDSHEISRNLLHILAKRIRSGNEAVSSSLERQRQHEREAQIDALTGLHNRRWIDLALTKHFNECIKNNTWLSVVMIDIDHFKSFNDTYGHQAGDKVLKQVSATMKCNLRPNEIVARYGGEEFIILLPSVPVDIAHMIAERVRNGVSESYYLDDKAGNKVPISISLGIAQLQSENSKEELLNHADEALYRAKQMGRNQTQVYHG